MHSKPRKLVSGKEVWDFWYYDSTEKKNKKLHRSEIPSYIDSQEKADEFCNEMAAKYEAASYRIKQKLEWKKKYHKWDKLLKEYEPACKLRAPQSYQVSIYYLEQYVMPFFTARENNAHLWRDHYDAFKKWLMSPEVKSNRRKSGDTVAYNTANNCISSMNSFLTWMKENRKMGDFEKCAKFPSDMINVRGLEDVLLPEEVENIGRKINDVDKEAFEFFTLLINSGLRIHEAFGVSLASFYEGQPNNETFAKLLQRNKLKCYGYIFVNSQIADRVKHRDKNNKVKRKPLKGRKKIEPDEGRLVPIIDKAVFNMLAKRYNATLEKFDKKLYGKDEQDYLLFEKYNFNTFSNLMKEAYQNTSYKIKTPHCCRHTFATYFVGKHATGDFTFCRLVLGHKDIQTTERYAHIFEAISRAATVKSVRKAGGMKLVK